MTKTIGILDSGIGGLTLLKELIESNFDSDYYYISDSENVPYGGKTQDFMLERISTMVQKLLDKDVEAIVIACNTATAETIDKLRQMFEIPFFGIEPYINYLNTAQSQESDNYALILTTATYQSKRFKELQLKCDPTSKITVYPLKNLAMQIEQFSFHVSYGPIAEELMAIKDKGHTHLILGCTHYPIIANYLSEHLSLKTINPASRVVSHIAKNLNLIKSSKKCSSIFHYNFNNSDDWDKKSLSDFSFLNLTKQ